jgi:uncharacterized protein (DUF169 family)
MIDTLELLDDAAFAKSLLAKTTLSDADLVFSLRNLLRKKYYPVAVKFFFSPEELDAFTKDTEYMTSAHPFTFCHYLAASRQRGDILLSRGKGLGCANAKYIFGWKGIDENEIKSQMYSSHR